MTFLEKFQKQASVIQEIKFGTEVEDNTFQELDYLSPLLSKIAPITLKIGGVEARQDIRYAISNPYIHKILAPMVESAYSFDNFMKTTFSLEKELNQTIQKAFNIETISCVNVLDDIIHSDYFSALDSITIGRGDLSQSIKVNNVNDSQVNSLVQRVIEKLSSFKKKISIGGGLTATSYEILKSLNYSQLSCNTRHIMFNFNSTKDQNEFIDTINTVLKLEVMMYENLQEHFPERNTLYHSRINTVNSRLSL